MKKIGYKIISLLIASVCVAAVPLSACGPQEAEEPAEEYSVVLDYNDDSSRPHTVYVEIGESMQTPENPLQEGRRVTGWTFDKEGENEVTFPYKPESDVTLYAQWQLNRHTVTIDYDYNDTVKSNEVDYGTRIDQPEDIEWAGHFIYRWLTGEGAEVSFPYMVRRDVTLVADWRSNTDRVTVSFDLNYDDAPAVGNVVLVSEPLTERLLPTHSREGYVLLGWATSATATEPEITAENLPYTFDGDVTLYAVWQLGTYNVTFNLNYTGAANQIYRRDPVRGWDEVNAPADPTRTQDGFNFEFLGWFTSDMGGREITFPQTITRVTNYYAHWAVERLTPENNIFDAEFTPIAADASFPGYSGSGTGPKGGVQNDDGFIQPTSANYPKLQGEDACTGHYVGMLNAPQMTLTFNIYSTADDANATLYARLATEIVPDMVITSYDSDTSYQFKVNGINTEYGEISFEGLPDIGRSDQYCNAFRELRIGGISLRQGWNTIELVTNNANTIQGGTTAAFAPMVDYIRIETSSTLSWQPVFDNLYSFRSEW